jgi:ABC-type uncharacterized transport system substrate-binding protein
MLIVIATSAHGHPHAFVVTSYTIVFDNQGLKGVRVYWEFDEMYSTTTATEFDLNGDGKLSESESRELIKLGKESLPSLNFFTNIQIDGVAYDVASVDDFRISYEKGILVYKFFVDCPVKASKNGNKIKISPYDNDLYLAMLFRQGQPVDFENSELYNVETSIGEDKDTLIYYDSMHPYALNLEFSKK